MLKCNYGARRNKLRRRLKSSAIDGILITNEVNVTYLTGFTGDSSCLWVGKKKDRLLSDSRYQTQISEQCQDLDTLIRDSGSTILQLIGKFLAAEKICRFGFEAEHVSKAFFDSLKQKTESELIDTCGWVEALRAIKDRSEIEKIRNSIRVNEKAFQVIRAQLTGEQTERQIAHELESKIRSFGGSSCAFDPIVGVGDRSALPHGIPSAKKISEAHFVLIDWGAKVQGYSSDLTRILATTKIPPKIRKIYNIVLKAQVAAIGKIRPGVSFKTVDGVARGIIDKAGFGNRFGHGLGHGFGLQIHEAPSLSPIRDGVFEPNMVVTVEPGIYLPGVGGVRIEDDVLVTKSGCEILSSLPKNLDENIVDL